MVKECRACHQTKPIAEFYRHGDGHMGKCKECWKADVKLARHTNPRVREYDRQRSKLPHRVANATRATREWRRKHRDRMSAHNAAARAGFVAPTRCEGCNKPSKVEKHHPDYSRPLVIVWLCKPCHAVADKIRRRVEA